jgi:hypothetical protein
VNFLPASRVLASALAVPLGYHLGGLEFQNAPCFTLKSVASLTQKPAAKPLVQKNNFRVRRYSGVIRSLLPDWSLLLGAAVLIRTGLCENNASFSTNP